MDNRKKRYCVHNSKPSIHNQTIRDTLGRMQQGRRAQEEYNKTLRLLDLTNRNKKEEWEVS